MDNNHVELFPTLLAHHERAIIVLIIRSRWKSTRHRGNLWRRKTYRPLIALIDNHSKDAARFWGSALFSFQFLPLTVNPLWGQMVYDVVLSLPPLSPSLSLSLSLSHTIISSLSLRLFLSLSVWFYISYVLVHASLVLSFPPPSLLLCHRSSWLWKIAMIEHVNVWFGLYRCL